MSEPLLEVRGLTKRYSGAAGDLTLFEDLNVEVNQGELLAIVGESGSGKSTLLHLLSSLDEPSAGEILFEGRRLAGMKAADKAQLRNQAIGYVWQAHYLLPEFTAAENVAMPLLAWGVERRSAMKQAQEWLAQVGLSDRSAHRAGELSGGEQQRVALARALVTGPRLLLADEPTGNLDRRTGDAIFDLLRQLHRGYGLTTVVVTHNMEFASRCDRVLVLSGGRLEPQSAWQFLS